MATFRVAVSGPTGSGKTTFAGVLVNVMGANLIRESIPHDLFAEFAEEPKHCCYALQRAIIYGRLQAVHRAEMEQNLVFDRTICEDREVFFRLHRKLGLLTEQQLSILRARAILAEHVIGSPDVYVYMTASRSVLESRMQAVNTPSELLASLDSQLELYTKWKSSYASPVLTIDTTDLSVNCLSKLAEWVADSFSRIEEDKLPRNDSLGLAWSR